MLSFWLLQHDEFSFDDFEYHQLWEFYSESLSEEDIARQKQAVDILVAGIISETLNERPSR